MIVGDEYAGIIATKFLLERSDKKIPFLYGDSRISGAKDRFDGYDKALKEFVGRWDEDRVVYSDQSYFCWNGGGADTENAARMLEKWIQWLRNWTLRTKRTILPLSIAHEFWNSICVEYDGIIGIQGRYT